MMEGQEHVVYDSSILRNDEHNILGNREKGTNVEESRITPLPILIRSLRIHTDLVSSVTEKLQELMVPHTTPSSSSPSNRAKFMPRKSFVTLVDHLYEAMANSLPTMVDKHIKEQVEKHVPEQVRNQVLVYVTEGLILERQKTKKEMEKMIAKAILQEHTSVRSYMSRHILHVYPARPQTTSVPEQQYQLYLSMKDDPQWQQQDITIWKILMMMLIVRGRKVQSGRIHQSMKHMFLESRHLDRIMNKNKVHQHQPEKIVLSLYKFPEVVSNDDDIEERTSIWVNKCVNKFNPYARYGVEHWKNPHAKIFYIRKQKEPRKPKEIIARRANDFIVSITEPDFKNLNKNDIDDMYLLIMNEKVSDYAETGLLWSLSVFIKSSMIWEKVHDFQLGTESYQQKANLTAPTIYFPEVKKHEMFFIIYEHSLRSLKSYNDDVRYGYNQRDLTKDEAEYLKLFEEEIKDRLKYRRQMRRWTQVDSYVFAGNEFCLCIDVFGLCCCPVGVHYCPPESAGAAGEEHDDDSANAGIVSNLHTLQSHSPSGVIHLNETLLDRISNERSPNMIIFFDAILLYDKPEPNLKFIRSEFALISNSFILDNQNKSSLSKVFFFDIEFGELEKGFQRFGIQSLPKIRIVPLNVEDLKSDSIPIVTTVI
nr:probable dolichyl-diphosphooligosaccharide--protein glycosyltransferase subunit 3B [Tanacetum cinerariifolium]